MLLKNLVNHFRAASQEKELLSDNLYVGPLGNFLEHNEAVKQQNFEARLGGKQPRQDFSSVELGPFSALKPQTVFDELCYPLLESGFIFDGEAVKKGIKEGLKHLPQQPGLVRIFAVTANNTHQLVFEEQRGDIEGKRFWITIEPLISYPD